MCVCVRERERERVCVRRNPITTGNRESLCYNLPLFRMVLVLQDHAQSVGGEGQ